MPHLAFLRRFCNFLSTRQAELQRLLNVMRELGRLRVAERQLDQWAVVLGWSLHLPWSDRLPAPDEQRTGVDPSLLPASMRLAEPTLRDERERAGAVALGVATLTRAGWRARAFLDLVKAHDRSDDAAEVEQAIARLDADEAPETGPLSRFRSALDAGDPQRRVLPPPWPRGCTLGPRRCCGCRRSSSARRPQGATVHELGGELEHEALVKVAIRVDMTMPLEATSLRLFRQPEAVASRSPDGDPGRFL